MPISPDRLVRDQEVQFSDEVSDKRAAG